MTATPEQEFRAHVLAAVGYAPAAIEPGRMQRFATSDRRSDTAGWCKLFDDLRGGVFGCYRQGLSESWSAADRVPMTREQRAMLARQVMAATVEREAEQRKHWADNAQHIARLWAQCVPLVPGDPCTLYLERRGLGGVCQLPAVLRLHRALPYWRGPDVLDTFPALVAPIVAADGRTVALHRTYLTADGFKADVPSPKKVTGAAGPLAGACIPLQKHAHGVIGVAEGIETALAASLASGVPTVAAYCASALAGYLWPSGVRRLVIFADNDMAGRAAADALRIRALAAGLPCDVLTPAADGADWCDQWAASGVVANEVDSAA